MSWENSSESSVYFPIHFSRMAFTANIIFSLFSLAKSMESCIQLRYCLPSLVSTGREGQPVFIGHSAEPFLVLAVLPYSGK